MTALVFPVGHYLGPHYFAPSMASPRPAAPVRAENEASIGHRVRLGPSLRWLGTEPEVLAWTLAHGLGELADDEPWTRRALAEYALRLAELDVADAIEQLVERRLLVEVDPAGAEAPAFAKSHRLRGLMLALGRDPVEPDAVLLGVAGAPVVALSELGHAVWHAGQSAPTLWDACHAVAEADPEITDAGILLPELLSELHGLLGAGVAYLDAAEGESFDAAVAVD